MATVPISIKTDSTSGSITVDPTVACVHPSDLIQWGVVSGTSLTISFKNSSPFDQVQLQGPGSVEKGIPADSPLGERYHYSLTAIVGNTTFVIPGCPEIVVQ